MADDFPVDDDGKPIYPGDMADVPTMHAYNVALAKWLEAQGADPDDPSADPDDPQEDPEA